MTFEDASITNLLEELGRRCPAFAAALIRPDDKNETETLTYLIGNRATCLGLAHILVSRCEVRLGMRPDPEDYDADEHKPEDSGDSDEDD
jgi:hypothetical protein